MGSSVLCSCFVGDAAKDSVLATCTEISARSSGRESSET